MSTVTAYVLDTRTGVETATFLGSYMEALAQPCLSIGSDPRCRVVLPDAAVAPIAVTFRARGHHIGLARWPEGGAFPLDMKAVRERRLGFGYRYAEEPVTIGPYVVRLSFARTKPDVPKPRQVDLGDVSGLVAGTTTKAAVRQLFGEPNSESWLPAGDSWTYFNPTALGPAFDPRSPTVRVLSVHFKGEVVATYSWVEREV